MTSDSSTFHFNLGAEKGSVIPYVVLTFQVILGAPGRTQRNGDFACGSGCAVPGFDLRSQLRS